MRKARSLLSLTHPTGTARKKRPLTKRRPRIGSSGSDIMSGLDSVIIWSVNMVSGQLGLTIMPHCTVCRLAYTDALDTLMRGAALSGGPVVTAVTSCGIHGNAVMFISTNLTLLQQVTSAATLLKR